MKSLHVLSAGAVIGACCLVSAPALAQPCTPAWSALGAGVNNTVRSFASIPAGPQMGLYVGGEFSTAGGAAANRVARWNGTAWSALAEGVNHTAFALAVFDDGGGPALYVGGRFDLAGTIAASRIAKWDGKTWSTLGTGMNGDVFALTVYDDGGGAALYAGGAFTEAGGVPANRIAKWNGTSWSALTSGLNNTVNALTVYSPPAGGTFLYAGGAFTNAGGVGANRVARWNGTAWAALSSGANNIVNALAVYTPPGGSAFLYAGGDFTSAGGIGAVRAARWNGTAWAALSTGCNDSVNALAAFDSGSGAGAELYAGGDFTQAGPTAVSRIAKWNGTAWSALGSGVSTSPFIPAVHALKVHDDGGGAALYVGGFFTTAGPVGASRVARWGCPAVVSTPCPADFDASDSVNGLDLALLLASWTGTSAYAPCPPFQPQDLNQDCMINGLDLALVLATWGPCP